jgi:hypothetical protein
MLMHLFYTLDLIARDLDRAVDHYRTDGTRASAGNDADREGDASVRARISDGPDEETPSFSALAS